MLGSDSHRASSERQRMAQPASLLHKRYKSPLPRGRGSVRNIAATVQPRNAQVPV